MTARDFKSPSSSIPTHGHKIQDLCFTYAFSYLRRVLSAIPYRHSCIMSAPIGRGESILFIYRVLFAVCYNKFPCRSLFVEHPQGSGHPSSMACLYYSVRWIQGIPVFYLLTAHPLWPARAESLFFTCYCYCPLKAQGAISYDRITTTLRVCRVLLGRWLILSKLLVD